MFTAGSCGHSDSEQDKKLGPRSHLLDSRRLLADIPRDTSSAGFSEPGTYFHCLTSVDSVISAILFDTNVLNRDDSFLIHQRTDMLSVQKNVASNMFVKYIWIVAFRRTAKVAAVNSRRGTVIFFKGLTRARLIRSVQ